MKTFRTAVVIAGILVAGIAFNTIAQPAASTSDKTGQHGNEYQAHKDHKNQHAVAKRKACMHKAFMHKVHKARQSGKRVRS